MVKRPLVQERESKFPTMQKKTVNLGSGVEMEFMPIPAGSFQMGSVRISQPFWLAKTEVTQRQYKQVMGGNPSHFQGLENPVENVSWNDAVSFCKKLTEIELRAGRLPTGYEYVLPTEAQWEYACRAGTMGKRAGNLDSMGWYRDNSGSKMHPVGAKQASAWGLHDMHGNVWEWCSDGYGSYGSGSVVDPKGASSGSWRVNRGGVISIQELGVFRATILLWRARTHPIILTKQSVWLKARRSRRYRMITSLP